VQPVGGGGWCPAGRGLGGHDRGPAQRPLDPQRGQRTAPFGPVATGPGHTLGRFDGAAALHARVGVVALRGCPRGLVLVEALEHYLSSPHWVALD